jgi:hypothetical protein
VLLPPISKEVDKLALKTPLSPQLLRTPAHKVPDRVPGPLLLQLQEVTQAMAAPTLMMIRRKDHRRRLRIVTIQMMKALIPTIIGQSLEIHLRRHSRILSLRNLQLHEQCDSLILTKIRAATMKTPLSLRSLALNPNQATRQNMENYLSPQVQVTTSNQIHSKPRENFMSRTQIIQAIAPRR